jgi:hypothetical protein
LQHVAHARSGDKGDTSNIAVFAYEPELYPLLLKEQLTAERFKAFYRRCNPAARCCVTPSTAFMAINYVCHGALGGGVSRSLCLDNYGKSLSAAVLGFRVGGARCTGALLKNHEVKR